MIQKIKKLLPDNHPLRLLYHKLWGVIAAYRYRFPSRKLTVIGITGTDGKTTTCTFVYEILRKAGIQAGLATSVEFAIGDKRWKNKTHRTTLGRFGLQKVLRDMVNNNCTHVVVETSSHAIKQHRIWGIDYDVVAITNITPEHLDFHKNFEDYRNTKAKLLKILKHSKQKGQRKTAVLDLDEENYTFLSNENKDHLISVSMEKHSDIHASQIRYSSKSTNFLLHIDKEKIPIHLHLASDFNVKNALIAVGITHSLGVSTNHIKKGLESIQLIPGRMESIDEGQPFSVFIDYAMTPEGYKNILSFLKKHTEGPLWIVFGCCGDRDKEKRPILGEITHKYCDKVILTDDEPYTENPEHIRNMVEEGLKANGAKKAKDYTIIPDRKDALEYALTHIPDNGTLIVPGMGDLDSRTIGNKKVPWSDREVIKDILKKHNS